MAKIQFYRLLGGCSLGLLVFLIIQSFYTAPAEWKDMPDTKYVIDHPKEFEGKEIYSDGTVSDVKTFRDQTTFVLNPVAKGLFGGLQVETKDAGIKDGTTGVNVHGTIRNGILEADTIRVSAIPGYMESLFNAAALIFFMFFSMKEWRLMNGFPFLKEVK